jgi:branched-chain amino acid transport system permease protein
MTNQTSSVQSGPWQQLKASYGRVSETVRGWWSGATWYQRWAVYLLMIVAAILLPYSGLGPVMTPGSDWPTVLFNPIGTYVLLAIGLNVVVGMAGLLDLGYVAFYAIGGYTMAVLGTKAGLDFWLILPAAILATATSGVILGAPTLRLRGDYLAIVTLGFGEIVRIVATNTDPIGGPNGIAGIPHPPSFLTNFTIFGVQPFVYEIVDARPYYYLVLALIVLAIVFVKRLERSRVGRAWVAIREDEDAAEIMGVPTFRFKLLSFAIGASIGGASGVMFAAKQISITPIDFQFILSATIVAAVVLGGSGNLPGVILGGFLIAWLPERFRVMPEWLNPVFGWLPDKDLADYRVMAFGAALVLMMIFRPEGLLPSRRRRAEFAEGSGGMGSMGAEVGGPGTAAAAEVSASDRA